MVFVMRSGLSLAEAARSMGVSRAALSDWVARYRAEGWYALRAAKRGGRKAKIEGDDMRWLYDTLTVGGPRQFGFSSALWTLTMLREVLATQRGSDVSRWAVSRVMRQMGFPLWRPVCKITEKDSDQIRAWKGCVYPKIRQQARQEDALICFMDESEVRRDSYIATTCAPRGPGRLPAISVAGIVSVSGAFRFVVFPKRLTLGEFTKILGMLVEEMDRKVHLIVDDHPTHRSRAARRFVREHPERLVLHLLPPGLSQCDWTALLCRRSGRC